MKIMSFNVVGPHKRTTLKRVVNLEHPDILLLHETLGVGDVIKDRLESWFLGWVFAVLDARGRSGGLAIGWKEASVKAINLWGMDSVLGLQY